MNMHDIQISLLRGVCQIPAYVAFEKDFFKDEGINLQIAIEPTAWQVPHKLETDLSQFAIFPWTRVAAAEEQGIPLVTVAGSGHEEAAIIVRKGMNIKDVKSVAIPQRGGMKDLTAMGLLESLGWQDIEQIRQPSGDGAIIAFFGMGTDAASMIEPYATMLEEMGVGRIVKRTGDIWPGAPGCSLSTTWDFVKREPDIVYAMVKAFVRGHEYVKQNPDEVCDIARKYIGVNPGFIRAALKNNHPDIDAIRSEESMNKILSLMIKLGYIKKMPSNYLTLEYVDRVKQDLGI